MGIKEFLFGKKEEKVIIPEQPAREDAWLASNFTFRWVERLHQWGVSHKDYAAEREKRKTDEESLFALYQQLTTKHKKDYLALQSLYYERAMMCAELGRDLKRYLALAQKSILAHYRQSKNVKGVVIEAHKDACQACRKLDGWLLSLPEAEKEHPLPHAKCTKKHGKRAFCRCSYGPMTDL